MKKLSNLQSNEVLVPEVGNTVLMADTLYRMVQSGAIPQTKRWFIAEGTDPAEYKPGEEVEIDVSLIRR